MLQRKYATRPIDLIVALASRPLRVALRNRKDLFSNAPVVFVSVDPKAAADLRLDADVTGTWLHMGWTETLDLARRVQPDIRRAVVIGGVSPADRVWLDQARQQLAVRSGSVEVEYLAGPSLEDVLKCGRRPPDADGCPGRSLPARRDRARLCHAGGDRDGSPRRPACPPTASWTVPWEPAPSEGMW